MENASPVSDVANRYAAALFELTEEAESTDQMLADLSLLEALFAESDDLVRVVRAPVFALEERVAALAAVCEKAGMTALALNFVKLAAQNNRAFALPDMIRGYRALVAAKRGEEVVYVTTAETMSAAHVKSLTAALKSTLGKEVTLAASVDPALLGGLIVQVGSRMIDTSLKTKLNSLRIAMKEVG